MAAGQRIRRTWGSGSARMIHDYLLARHSTTAPHISTMEKPMWESRVAGQMAGRVLAAQPDLVCICLDVAEPPDKAGSEPHERASMSSGRATGNCSFRTKEFAARCKLVLCEPDAIWSNIPVEADDRCGPMSIRC